MRTTTPYCSSSAVATVRYKVGLRLLLKMVLELGLKFSRFLTLQSIQICGCAHHSTQRVLNELGFEALDCDASNDCFAAMDSYSRRCIHQHHTAFGCWRAVAVLAHAHHKQAQKCVLARLERQPKRTVAILDYRWILVPRPGAAGQLRSAGTTGQQGMLQYCFLCCTAWTVVTCAVNLTHSCVTPLLLHSTQI
jgi:hypothetical protein